MKVHLCIRNESQRKRVYRTTELRHLAERVCSGEGVDEDIELSVLLCDDPFIRDLNRTYRNKDAITDVLAFCQTPVEHPIGSAGPDPIVLGDIVISLESVERYCRAEMPNGHPTGSPRAAMRKELRLLFCHGLLHLLGSDHTTAQARTEMNARQAHYLGTTMQAAWRTRANTPRGR